MECYYHHERESTDQCAICGKNICKECGLEIAGKIYCKDCLEKIVGLSVEKAAPEPEPVIAEEPTVSEVVDESIYQPQTEAEYEIPSAPQEEVSYDQRINDESPYNIKDNIEYSGGLESSYMDKSENIYQEPPVESQPQVAQNESVEPNEAALKQKIAEDDFIYPDHSYEPQPTNARLELEDKYEKYLDDLYFDENEVPLNEQLAKDEAQYGSLTRREYAPRPTEAAEQKPISQMKAPKNESPEEMEARIRAEILREQGLINDKDGGNIHNINYKDEKEPMGVVDILLTIILIIVILIVVYYLIYLFLMNSMYPTFLDAIFALKNPQNVINNILSH